MASEIVEIEGHIIDSLILAKVMDLILAAGADYRVLEVEIGKTNMDTQPGPPRGHAADADALQSLLDELQVHGANRVDTADAELVACRPRRGASRPASTRRPTCPPRSASRAAGSRSSSPEMDCGLVYDGDGYDGAAVDHGAHAPRPGRRPGRGRHRGGAGVAARSGPAAHTPFEFMNSEVSSEKPKALLVGQVAERIRLAKAAGAKVLAVCGPAVIHTGAGPSVGGPGAARAGSTCCSRATASPPTTSSPTSWAPRSACRCSEGTAAEGGHSNHLRVINEIRRYGSIARRRRRRLHRRRRHVRMRRGGACRSCSAARCATTGRCPTSTPTWSRRPTPCATCLPGVGVALMLASTLHAIATGNLLPAGVETFCVDINPAVVTKLADRGSHQALGIVTDVGLFTSGLVDQLGRRTIGGRRAALAWGRRYLMCPPALLRGACTRSTRGCTAEVVRRRRPGPGPVGRLVATLRAAGAEVEVQPPAEGWPDLVFTANAGIVNGRQFVPARFRHPERQGETPYDVGWFAGPRLRGRRAAARGGPRGGGRRPAVRGRAGVGLPVPLRRRRPRLPVAPDRRRRCAPSSWSTNGCTTST